MANVKIRAEWLGSRVKAGSFVMERKTKIKFTDFECNLLINGMNEFRNLLLAEDLPKEDVDELLLKIIKKIEP